MDLAQRRFLDFAHGVAWQAFDEEHPFGYGLASYFWAFMAALSISRPRSRRTYMTPPGRVPGR